MENLDALGVCVGTTVGVCSARALARSERVGVVPQPVFAYL